MQLSMFDALLAPDETPASSTGPTRSAPPPLRRASTIPAGPITTPGTRITWSNVREWLDASDLLHHRRAASKTYQQQAAHLRALTREVVERETDLAALAELLSLLKSQRYLEPRGQRGGTHRTRLVDFTYNRLETLRAAAGKLVAQPEPAAPEAPKLKVRKRPSAAALGAVAAVLSDLPGLDVLCELGVNDHDLDSWIRRFARPGRQGTGCRLSIDRRKAVLQFDKGKQLKGRVLVDAVRELHRIPQPQAPNLEKRPPIGRITDPLRLPTRRWGYRSDGHWWMSADSKDRDGANGFRRVYNPVTIAKLDAWALDRFPHLHPRPEPTTPSPAPSAAAAPSDSMVQGDFLLTLEAGAVEATKPRNYRITGYEGIGAGSLRKKAAINLEVIRLLRRLAAEGRAPTHAEQAALVRYCGWGAIPQVFSDDAPGWAEERAELQRHLTRTELRSAEASTPNAHFTSLTVIGAMYAALERLGFRGGRMLEAGAGVGHFIGAAPDSIAASSRWTAVESDQVSGAVLSRLYPEEDVRIARLEHTRLRDGAYDVAVGNVPFGSYTVFDAEHNPDNDLRIHDYFVLRSLAALRPGGLLLMVSSRGTMDKKSRKVRERIAAAADLLGAVRLPNTAFLANAGTKVTTDILILRKRERSEPAAGHAWLDTLPVESPDGVVWINEYFAANPGMMLGEMRLIRGLHADHEPTLAPTPGVDLADALRAAVLTLPTDVYREPTASPADTARDDALAGHAAQLREGKFTSLEGTLYQKRGGTLVRALFHSRKDSRRVQALSQICCAIRRVLHSQDAELPLAEQDAARDELNRHYDAFTAVFGSINTERRSFIHRKGADPVLMVRRPNLQAFRGDPDWPLVAALEIYDPETDTATKAPIFTQRVVRPTVEITQVDDVVDALLVCLDRHARVDLEVIAKLWGRPTAEAEAALAGRIYHDPQTGRWETADAYLSGPVRAKLDAARAAADRNPKYLGNAVALEAVQPVPLEPSQIECTLGASWLPTEVVAQFIRHLLGRVTDSAGIEVRHFAREALWRLEAPPSVRGSIEATRTWGTERADAIELIEHALNQREPQIFDYFNIDGKRTRVLNVVATVDAAEKQAAIVSDFESWVWADGARAKQLLEIYNETFNGYRLQEFDGSHLRFPGASDAVVLDPHQVNGVWRIVSTGNTLVAHCVGAGKTFLAAAAGMKLRQVGLARKVLHVTMNHMLEQFARETIQLYPNARLLVAGSDDLSGDGRRLFMARVAEGDFDAIVVTHGAFGKLPLSRQFQEDFLRGEVASYEAMLKECDPEDRISIKEITAALKQMEARLEGLVGRKNKDELLTFEELGVDAMFIDEIHLFKNLDTPSKIVGIPRATRPSQRATDLLMKAIYLDRHNPGRGFVGMSGTPISNTIAEMHVMARLHAPHLLARRGIEHFDAFAGTFIKRVNAPELSPDGRTYRVRTRFHFTNVAELVVMFRTFADVQMAKSYYEAPDGDTFEGGTLELPIPKLAGGKPEVIAAKATDALREFVDTLVERAQDIRDRKVKPWEDNMLAVVGDGRKAALDLRLINPAAEDRPGSKINLAVAQIYATWAETAAERLTQLVFTDLSRPRNDGRFSVSNDLRGKLIAMGVPEGEIAFAQDATTDTRKAMLFKSVREGRVRILIGSTETMGTGTNVQDRLVRIHHLDAPWRPSDIEQRDGRMMRRGNRNPVCRITRYVTEESFDAYTWNLLHYKLTMINRIMLGDLSIRRVSEGDAAELSYAQLKAVASGNKLVLEKAAVDQRVLVLGRARRAFEDARIRSRIDRVELPARIASDEAAEAAYVADKAAREDSRGDRFTIDLALPGDFATGTRETFTRRSSAATRLREILSAYVQVLIPQQSIGSFAGFELTVRRTWGAGVEIALRGRATYSAQIDLRETTPAGNLQVLENLPKRIEGLLQSTRENIVYLRQQLETLEAEATEFPGEGEYQRLLARQAELDRELRPDAASEQAALIAAAAAQQASDSPAEFQQAA